jgi:hypothetical protein
LLEPFYDFLGPSMVAQPAGLDPAWINFRIMHNNIACKSHDVFLGSSSSYYRILKEIYFRKLFARLEIKA